MAKKHKDYYKILGVTRKSTADEIKAAYRKLAMKYHPDKNPGDDTAKENFLLVSEAYEVLSDKDKKMRYDAECAITGDVGAGMKGWDKYWSTHAWDFAQQWAKAKTSGMAKDELPIRGQDVSTECDIELEDVIFGGKKELPVMVTDECGDCHGTGCKSGTARIYCPLCGGTGMLANGTGYYQVTEKCPRCGGAGKIPEHPCETCKGQGVKSVLRTFMVSVPSGVDTGTTLRLAGRGNAGLRGGERGDLYVTVCVKEHEIFRRQGFNLLADIPMSPFVSALGGEVDVVTPDGYAVLSVPAGTPNGKVFKMKGKGIVSVKGNFRGDLLLTAKIETPSVLTNDQKEALETARNAMTAANFPDAAKFYTLGGVFLHRMSLRQNHASPRK